jgi:hypothetical protein
MPSDDQRVFNLNLTKVLKGNSEPIKLQTCVTKLDDNTWDCFLITLDIKGVPIADGLEVALGPENETFKGDQTWKLKESPQKITSADEDENEFTTYIKDVVFKMPENGENSAMIVLDENGETSVATENWQ